MSYTKGEWKVGLPNRSKDENHNIGIRCSGWVIADLCNDTGREVNQEANARLISASPNLLEACKKALKHLKRCGYSDPKNRHGGEITELFIKQAIDKAE